MNEQPNRNDDSQPQKDIAPILEGWDFKPGEVVARIVVGADGHPKLQMRLPLGLYQMELQGRPDGLRPFGLESLLERQIRRRDQHRAEHGSLDGFELTADECAELADEARTYYYRYLCLFQLGEFAGVARDTARNLTVLDFLREHASKEYDLLSIEQFRPYIIMMNARARAHLALERKAVAEAFLIVRDAMGKIRRFYKRLEETIDGLSADSLAEASMELQALKTLMGEIRGEPIGRDSEAAAPVEEAIANEPPPQPSIKALRDRLNRAVESEDFDLAAALRDRIRELEKSEKT